MLIYVFVVVLVLIHDQICLGNDLREECCIKLPKAMDINKFQARVATGEDWVAILSFVCPFDAAFAEFEQFRITLNVTNGDLKRRINFRPKNGDPCNGVFNDSLDQVSAKKAVFRQESGRPIIEILAKVPPG